MKYFEKVAPRSTRWKKYGDYFYIPMVTQKKYINFSGYMLEVVVRFMGFLNARWNRFQGQKPH